MPNATVSEEVFSETFRRLGPQGTSDHLGIPIRTVYARRKRIEDRTGAMLATPPTGIPGADASRTRVAELAIQHPQRHFLEIENGVVLIGSDAHYWPGIVTTAHKGFVRFAKKLQPKAIILNGDVFDGASISRHPSIGWENKPSVIQEIETCTDRLNEIQKAAPNAKRIWTLGNHDARFESRLANVAPEYARVNGAHLKDHFPYWIGCWSCWINPDDYGGPVIKHRLRSGIHAPHNNTVNSGRSMITGHLHSLKVQPFTDYNGTRYGVDSGTLAEPYGPQFVDYCEDAPVNWRSGFVVLTFVNGKMLQPQMAMVIGDGEIDYCSEVIRV